MTETKSETGKTVTYVQDREPLTVDTFREFRALPEFQASFKLDQFWPRFASASAAIDNPAKDSINPHFKNRYASLEAVLQAIKQPLADNWLVFTQLPIGNRLINIIAHAKSGQYIQWLFDLHPQKTDPQGIGSAITYGRRYCIMSAFCMAAEDDDGNAGSGRGAAQDNKSDTRPPAASGDKLSLGKYKLERDVAEYRKAKDGEMGDRAWIKLVIQQRLKKATINNLPELNAIANHFREHEPDTADPLPEFATKENK